jgi:lipopolysaccharide transport protein LptA
MTKPSHCNSLFSDKPIPNSLPRFAEDPVKKQFLEEVRFKIDPLGKIINSWVLSKTRKTVLYLLITYMAFSAYAIPQGTDDAIYINSNTLEVDYAEGIAEYKTNVFVQKKGGFDLHCDRAKIFFVIKQSSGDKIKASAGNIKRIELYDNITIVKEPKIAKGDYGVIYPKKKLITLTGNVALKEKTDKRESYVEGSEVQYYMNEGIFKIKNEKSSDKGRVKIILNETKK